MRGHAQALWGEWRPSADVHTLDLTGHEIIEVSGNSVGCLAVEQARDHIRIRKLYIDAPHRRQGIGAAVLAQAVRAADSNGMKTRLSTLTPNYDAIRFYEREGFHIIATTQERVLLEYGVATALT